MFHKNKFRGKVVERGLTLADVSAGIGVNPATLTRKMSGESEFTRSEIQKIRNILNLSDEELNGIFFAEKLAETQGEEEPHDA